MKFNYEVSGTAADRQTWLITGNIEQEKPGDFPVTMDEVMRQVFTRLTKGEAIFGRPGIGCHGPYQIVKFLIEEATDDVR